ncbi:MAG TPA: recombinase family protein [Thermoanaerobaculia bacterium]|nr:recombinase family protein [Thermoanaerobaculia bacterium]
MSDPPISRSSRPKDEKRVGIWIRVSTEDQAKGDSPEHHEARARAYAEMKGWKVVTVYHLEAVSGKTVKNEPETVRMLEDVREGRTTGLIFSQLFRLGRNTRELLEISDFFNEHEADLISLAESIDTSTPIGKLYYTVTAAMGQCDREMTAARVAASVPIRAKLGKPLGGAAPFGYEWRDRKLVPNPEEAPVRKLLYELFLTHKRLKTVARLLTASGYRTRNGAAFSHTTVERLIRDPTAKGIRRANYTKSLGAKKRWTIKPEAEWVLVPVEAIIPEHLWEACNRLLDERRVGRKPAKRTTHLFSGVTFCTCGEKLYVPSNTPKYVCRKCRMKIPIVDLERVFEDELRAFVFSPEEIAEHLSEANRDLAEKRRLVESLERERAKVQAEMDRLYDLYMEEGMSSDGFGKRYRPLEERERQVAEELPHLQGEIDFLTIQYHSRDEILSESQSLSDRWPELPFEERRAVVEALVERITVAKDEITIDLLYHPQPPPLEIVSKGSRINTDSSPPAARSGRGRRGARGPSPR